MAKWDSAANDGFSFVKSASNSTDSEMAGLKRQIEAWANTHPDDSTVFGFGKLRNTGVRVTTVGGWIKVIAYGDRP